MPCCIENINYDADNEKLNFSILSTNTYKTGEQKYGNPNLRGPIYKNFVENFDVSYNLSNGEYLSNKDNTEYLVDKFINLVSAEQTSDYIVNTNRLENTFVSPRTSKDTMVSSYIENDMELTK